jgi:uncharacterized protein (DUF2252 family)
MPSYDEQRAAGKRARAACPRSGHAELKTAERFDPVEVIEQEASTRVPELVPIRHGRMLSSSFAFYRGAAAIMARDLSATPMSGLEVQCCGDAHLANFGVFASPERRLVFDVNDFDETHPGPWEWDVKRLATSMLIASRSNNYSALEEENIVLATVASYRESMRAFAQMGNLGVWNSHLEMDAVLARHESQLRPRTVKRTRKALAKARTKDSMQAFSKLTETVDGKVRIVDQSPLVVPLDNAVDDEERTRLLANLEGLISRYRESLRPDSRTLFDQFEAVDFARKVVGVGSVGTRCWIALFLGHEGREPLFLQIKEAEQSVLEPYVGTRELAHHGQRVVVGQRLMQASSDIFLGWVRYRPGTPEQRDFYCRQLRDWKGSAEIEQMIPAGMEAYGRLCGWTLARAHARSGSRVAISSYLGASDRFDRAVLEFADHYAAQNELDFKSFKAAVKSGRLEAEVGV